MVHILGTTATALEEPAEVRAWGNALLDLEQGRVVNAAGVAVLAVEVIAVSDSGQLTGRERPERAVRRGLGLDLGGEMGPTVRGTASRRMREAAELAPGDAACLRDRRSSDSLVSENQEIGVTSFAGLIAGGGSGADALTARASVGLGVL
ncbi:hypothetical protein EBH_0024370 [Eimeria brunetti]|uniref:Uncharacterized protein n=1 Tax=Eimeria brunetti TaxID=51314 RepID=U6LVH0_9EIME|nr:hypothetical protein EBH_0024370 [Eimeria brunetti]